MFDGVVNIFWVLLLSVAVMAILLIPGKEVVTYSHFKVNEKEYICPKGFMIDDNLTCYKTHKAKLVKK